MPPTVATTIRLPLSVHQQIEQQADSEGKTLADYLRQLISLGLNNGADHQRSGRLESRLQILERAVRDEGQQTRALIDQLASVE